MTATAAPTKGDLQQTTGQVVLVRPIGFGYDPETAASNGFQTQLPGVDATRNARDEFDRLVEALIGNGIGVAVLDPIDPKAPNAVFPNNWFSTHAPGLIVLYPMATASRRPERDVHLGEKLARLGFGVAETVDLGAWEQQGLILEGTGSMVLDRAARKAYAVWSPRTTRQALEHWCARMDFEPVGFQATVDGTANGQAVYHTNVLMGIGEAFAAVTLEAIPDAAERNGVKQHLEATNKEVIALSLAQMNAFAGNMLQLNGTQGPRILLSRRAHDSLSTVQRQALARHGELVPVAIPTIETLGGGSIRCMIAENFLPSGH
ncbi:MAG: amidinotransferase [Flavobacteriales bacterium]|nr:amidinotransferase [Flavobacteriales bacterium]